MIDKLIKKLCEEADNMSISLSVEDKKGHIDLNNQEIIINPTFIEEKADIFITEMVYFHYRQINTTRSREEEIESLLRNEDNRDYIIKYLDKRDIK